MLISIEAHITYDFPGGGGGEGAFYCVFYSGFRDFTPAFKNTFKFGFLRFNAGNDYFRLFSHKINVHLILLQSVNCEQSAVAGIFRHYGGNKTFRPKDVSPYTSRFAFIFNPGRFAPHNLVVSLPIQFPP